MANKIDKIIVRTSDINTDKYPGSEPETNNHRQTPFRLMSIDPYHAVQQEIETSLQNAGQLFASYRRIRNMARDDSEELTYARNEVCYLSPKQSCA